jgi:hypothetical protein
MSDDDGPYAGYEPDSADNIPPTGAVRPHEGTVTFRPREWQLRGAVALIAAEGGEFRAGHACRPVTIPYPMRGRRMPIRVSTTGCGEELMVDLPYENEGGGTVTKGLATCCLVDDAVTLMPRFAPNPDTVDELL